MSISEDTPEIFATSSLKMIREIRYTPMVIWVSRRVASLWDGRNHPTMTPQAHMTPVMGAMMFKPKSVNRWMVNMARRKIMMGYATALRYLVTSTFA